MSRPRQQDPPLLAVDGLDITLDGGLAAVDDVSFRVNPGQRLGLVGESACGKSLTARALLGLAPGQVSGDIRWCGRSLGELDEAGWRALRGPQIAMIFQEPETALNPVQRVGAQLRAVLRRHRGLQGVALREEVLEWLGAVDLPDPAQLARAYPHQLSGGMRQRVMIAMALCCRPRLLVADEPTTALDVTTQAKILELLIDRCARHDTALLLISHDLALVTRACSTVLVMYAGRIVEVIDSEQLSHGPHHPYTAGLLRCLPDIERRQDRLPVIPGRVPALEERRAGCAFAPRCERADAQCASVPALTPRTRSRAACHHPLP